MKKGPKDEGAGATEVLSEFVLKEGKEAFGEGGLLSEPEQSPEADRFNEELERSLAETQEDVLRLKNLSDETKARSWETARAIVEEFQPVPWFIWRLSNYVFSSSNKVTQLTDGAVLGLRRLLFAAASDSFLGEGTKVNSIHKALQILSPDVVAAVAVIHAVSKRLAVCQFERIWRPILDDAILRSQIGFLVGERNKEFGAGRGMLAGFAGRCGLAILIASGELEQARKALELLASGADISSVGMSVYGCDPLQVSAMTLTAAGCGRDAAFGTVGYASPLSGFEGENESQFCWLSAFAVVEMVRTGRQREVDERFWEALGYNLGQDRGDLVSVSESLLKRGHNLNWIC